MLKMKNIILIVLLLNGFVFNIYSQDTTTLHDAIVEEVVNPETNPQQEFSEVKIAEGKELFKTYCKSCHAITTRLTGPALAGVETRVKRSWIYEFVRNSAGVISSGDAYANELFIQYNQVEMTPYPNLTDNQIDLILDYIKTEELAAASAPKFKRPETLLKPYLGLNPGSYYSWALIGMFTFIVVTATYFVVSAGVKVNKS